MKINAILFLALATVLVETVISSPIVSASAKDKPFEQMTAGTKPISFLYLQQQRNTLKAINDSPEKAKLIKEAIETQQALRDLLKSNNALPPDLTELCTNRVYMSSYDLISSFRTWVKDSQGERTLNSETLDLVTAKHIATALHAWAYWYEEVLNIHDLQTPYWPIVVNRNKPRIKSDTYNKYWIWITKLKNVRERIGVLEADFTEKNPIVDFLEDSSVLGIIVTGIVNLTDRSTYDMRERYTFLDPAINIYETKELITEDIPKDWEAMLSEYMDVENGFYEMIDNNKSGVPTGRQNAESVLDAIITHYAKDYTVNREALDFLNNYRMFARRYFREVQKLARHEVLDIPTSALSYYWYIKFRSSAYNWYVNKAPGMDNVQTSQKQDMRSAALGLSTVNQFQTHCVSDSDRSVIIQWISHVKSYYSTEEWNEIVGQAKMKASWYDLAQRITAPVAPEEKK